MSIKHIIVACAFCMSTYVSSQIPVGTWRTHLSYGKGTSVAMAENVVYAISDGSLFSYRINDLSLSTYSKIDGLNDIFMTIVRYDADSKNILLGYDNGNIDLINGSAITNIPDIKIKSISGDKGINNLRFNNGLAYLALDFGIVVLNMDRAEVKETFKLNFNGQDNAVNDVEIMGDTIFAATAKGIYYGLLSTNLIDQRNWKVFTQAPLNSKPYYHLARVGSYLLGAQSDNINSNFGVYVLNDLNGKLVSTIFKLSQLQAKGNDLVIYGLTQVRVLDKNNNFSIKSSFTSYILGDEYKSEQNAIQVKGGYLTGDADYYIADNTLGLVHHKTAVKSSVLTPNGPQMNNLRRLKITNGKLRIAHGGEEGWNRKNLYGVISTFDNQKWSAISRYNNQGLIGLYDFMDLAVDPRDPEHYFATCWGNGVVEFQGETVVNVFNDLNNTSSSLINIIPGGPYTRTNGIAYDKDNNLWITNSEVPKPISCLKNDGTWVALRYTDIDNAGTKVYAHGKIMVADDGNKWVLIPRNVGIFIFNENGTIDDVSDDNTRMLQLIDADGEIISNDVYDIVQDLDGTIWVATANGPVLYYNVSQIFESPNEVFPGYRIKLPRNDGTGRADYLLDGEKIQCIAVDGGNRKWVGTTTSGLFLFSADGLQTIQHFTTDNSPLLSNTILTLEIDDESGEVFIGTDKGLLSYRSDASAGSDVFKDVAVFPNPVREDYSGNITITGLVPETNVKITDISGNLVYETTSNGGFATWNGLNFYGQRVGTGVYLIFCADKTGENSAMTKLLVIN